jgi:mannose PTS system EIIA component
MVGILLVSHGAFAESLIHCACHVMTNKPLRLTHLSVSNQDDPQRVQERAAELVKELDAGDGVLVMADICGATPSNIASRIMVPGKVEGVAGVNLPMLIRALTYRDQPLATVVQKALSGGREGVIVLPVKSK